MYNILHRVNACLRSSLCARKLLPSLGKVDIRHTDRDASQLGPLCIELMQIGRTRRVWTAGKLLARLILLDVICSHAYDPEAEIFRLVFCGKLGTPPYSFHTSTMRLPTILLAAIASVARAGLMNVSLDDTSQHVIYTASLSSDEFFRCTPRTSNICGESLTSRLFNGTSTVTSAVVVIPFTGPAVYVYLGVDGVAMFGVDGTWIFQYFGNDIDDIVSALSLTDLSNTPHILTMRGVNNDAAVPIQLDYVVYTQDSPASGRSAQTAAIAGSVVGGVVALIAAIFLGAFCLRRHAQRKRKGSRASWLRGTWTDKPGIPMDGVDTLK
ncbi:hypothetical protein C8F01DRAFT_1259946 [Mycena amicta]|nr:hypothetical protein C8F01DRAFT_1259946 [Mycena amicta]